MSETPNLTDRHALTQHRDRAANLGHADLHELAAVEIEERLQDVNKSFTKPLLVGHIPQALRLRFPDAQIIEDTDRLEIEPGAHDLVIHAFGLHWANDPVGQMVQCRLALEPDGLFPGVLFAGQTLAELRIALAEAETSLYGGLSPRVAPLADVRALGDLLLRAGLALPVADSLRADSEFASLMALARELRLLGETNALLGRRIPQLRDASGTLPKRSIARTSALPAMPQP